VDKGKIAKMIDHTVLGATITEKEIKMKCEEAKRYNFASVCAGPNHVELLSKELKESSVKICTVIGFPLGANLTKIKINEAKMAIEQGADELDMVINIGALKEEKIDLVITDIAGVVQAAGDSLVKVIIETCYLEDREIIQACKAAEEAKADFVKTSTGFGNAGAKTKDVRLIKETVGDKLGVKASGGIRSMDDAIKMIEAGATRLGASSGVDIIEGEKIKNDY